MPATQPNIAVWAEREATKKRRYPRSGQPWSADQKALRRRRFDEKPAVLADQHQRAPLGIRALLRGTARAEAQRVPCRPWKRYITSQTSWSTSAYAPPRRLCALDLKFG